MEARCRGLKMAINLRNDSTYAFIPSAPSPESPALDWTLVVAANDEQVLRKVLLASSAVESAAQVLVERNTASAAAAYNAGIAKARTDVVVFAHQDVYLPPTWAAALSRNIAVLQHTDRNWAVLGPFGIRSGRPPRPDGHCYSTGLGRVLGQSFVDPVPAHTLDELVLVVRQSSGLRFDAGIPGFHLYGSDICLQAAALGLGSYIVPAFCIHNSNGIRRLPRDFWRAYFYLRNKWRSQLPITSCCTTITKDCLPILHHMAIEWRNRMAHRPVGARCEDVLSLYRQLCVLHPELSARPALFEASRLTPGVLNEDASSDEDRHSRRQS